MLSPLYMRSVLDRNVIMRSIPVYCINSSSHVDATCFGHFQAPCHTCNTIM